MVLIRLTLSVLFVFLLVTNYAESEERSTSTHKQSLEESSSASIQQDSQSFILRVKNSLKIRRRGPKSTAKENTQTLVQLLHTFEEGAVSIQPFFEDSFFAGTNREKGRRRVNLASSNAYSQKEKLIKRVEFAARRREHFGLNRLFSLKVRNEKGVVDILSKIRASGIYERIEEDLPMEAYQTSVDTYLNSSGSWGQKYGDSWGLGQIDARTTWSVAKGRGMIVAVIDTGVDYRHPDLASNIWKNTREIPENGVDDDLNGFIDDVLGWNFVANNNDPMDGNGHGTHVAGIVGAVQNNGVGIVGVAPLVKIMPLKGLGDSGGGSNSNLIKAIIYAAENGAHVSNNSWGGSGESIELENAINYANSRGNISVVAAGNSAGDASDHTPANIESVITVGASTPRRERASFSNFGLKIDVLAPGGGTKGEEGVYYKEKNNILSTVSSTSPIRAQDPDIMVGADYCRLAGTSMAAPYVAGAAAILKSIYPRSSVDDIRARLRLGASSIQTTQPYRTSGAGILNITGAINVLPRPLIIVKSFNVSGELIPNAEAQLTFSVKNIFMEAKDVTFYLTSKSDRAQIVQGVATYSKLSKDQTAKIPFKFKIAKHATIDDSIEFAIEARSGNNMLMKSETVSVPLRRFSDVTEAYGLNLGASMIDGDLAMNFVDFTSDGIEDLHLSGRLLEFVPHISKYSIKSFKLPKSLMSKKIDFDNDGDFDLLLATYWENKLRLFRNDNGQFTDISEASQLRSGQPRSGFGFSVLDFDNDGFVDIFSPRSCLLYRNVGKGRFADVSSSSGISPCVESEYRLSQVIDYDADGKTDLLLLTGEDPHAYNGGILYRNTGGGGFRRIGPIAPYKATNAIVIDYNNDFYPDLFLGGPGGGIVWTNNTKGSFIPPELVKDPAVSTKLVFDDVVAELGTGAQDFDNNGYHDLFFSSQGSAEHRLFLNKKRAFQEYSFDAGLKAGMWNNAIFGDYDGDGDFDIFNLKLIEGKYQLFDNPQFGSNFTKIKLRGSCSNSLGLGARITVSAGEINQSKAVLDRHPDVEWPVHFGLGAAQSISVVEIGWPSGKVQWRYNLPINETIEFIEPPESTSALPWRNRCKPEDVNGDGLITPIDSITIANEIALKGSYRLGNPPTNSARMYFDVNGDGYISEIDFQLVLQYLNSYEH